MKLVPGPLPPVPTGAMDRVIPMPFSPEFFWRYPLGLSGLNQLQQPPSSPLLDYKSQLPNSLASDPRVWNRDDVVTFLRWAEREFDLQPIDMDNFQMNGKALCLLTRQDLSERATGSGDVIYNVIQILVRDASNLQRMLPSSPVTPTSRHPYPFSPHSHPPTPNWNVLSNNDSFHSTTAASIAAHFIAQNNSVTLSPAPSVDSQAGSPQHTEAPQSFSQYTFNSNGSSNGSNGSNPSDSDEESYDKNGANSSPPSTPSAYNLAPPPVSLSSTPKSPKEATSGPGVFKFMKREFFPNESPEPNTNGRLLWDFLQQLLNDPGQRYTSYIAWKNRETGVFKIVDPAGLAKLWGIQKNHLSMNYDKMSRALRYYYRVNILRKVQGERHCYQFLRNPSELKNIKNISLLRQQMSPTNTKPPIQLHTSLEIKPEPIEMQTDHAVNHGFEMEKQEQNGACVQDYDDKPTDLSMSSVADRSSSNTRHLLQDSKPESLLTSSRQISIVCSPDPPISLGAPPK